MRPFVPEWPGETARIGPFVPEWPGCASWRLLASQQQVRAWYPRGLAGRKPIDEADQLRAHFHTPAAEGGPAVLSRRARHELELDPLAPPSGAAIAQPVEVGARDDPGRLDVRVRDEDDRVDERRVPARLAFGKRHARHGKALAIQGQRGLDLYRERRHPPAPARGHVGVVIVREGLEQLEVAGRGQRHASREELLARRAALGRREQSLVPWT